MIEGNEIFDTRVLGLKYLELLQEHESHSVLITIWYHRDVDPLPVRYI